ncbi:MAG TPA: MFS transporter [Bacteroidales bacterium]|jgi:DHA3 family macrolide efflux protein-like MFS transporter|nr:MFS transporter [Bacteroidales bacterium]
MINWKRTFAIIWTGQLFSTLSSYVVGYSIMFWLSIETGSAEVLAFSIIASLLPQLVLGIFTGVYIDRWNRKRVMILADLFIAFCTLIVAILLYTGESRLSYFYILLAMRSAGMAFHMPAMQASVPLLAPEDKLMRIAGVNNIINSVSTIAGPALAALLISLFDLSIVLMFDVAGAVIACISLILVHIPSPVRKDGSTPEFLREMLEGLKIIYSKPGLFWLFILGIIATFFIMPVAALFPLMTLNHFSGTTYHMSIIEIAWGIGMLMGGALMGINKLKSYKIILIILMYLLLGLTFAFSGILPPSGFVIFAVITAFGGISMSVYSGSFTVVMQTMVEPSALGRVFSMYGSITLLPSMLGLLATGFIADSIGITNAFIISGIAISVLGLAAFLVPPVGKMVKEELKT